MVSWNPSIDKIVRFARSKGVKVSQQWIKELTSKIDSAEAICARLGYGGADLLVWFKKRPTSINGTVAHELTHALDFISESRGLDGEKEARAYLFEFLVNAVQDGLKETR